LKEEELLELQGNEIGQKILFDKYFSSMKLVAERYLKSNDDIQDVLSETFIRVFKRINQFEFRGEGSLNKWIKTITINESLRFIQKNKRLHFESNQSSEEINYEEDFDGDIDMKRIVELVQSLPEGYRIIFMMHVIEGYSHREIAEKLEISISTSKTQLLKARGKLIEKLKLERNEIF